MADVRIVFVRALKLQATALIICHNHPSGQFKVPVLNQPLTECLAEEEAPRYPEVPDYLIITSEGYMSIANEEMVTGKQFGIVPHDPSPVYLRSLVGLPPG